VRGAVTRDPARGDLRAGKPTLPLIYALNHAPKAERGARRDRGLGPTRYAGADGSGAGI
jgi:geranylgeranyl pyrophosphate synthase